MSGISDTKPGSIKGIHLVVADIDQARDVLTQRGVTVGELQDLGGVKYADFSDPDGNLWLPQQKTW